MAEAPLALAPAAAKVGAESPVATEIAVPAATPAEPTGAPTMAPAVAATVEPSVSAAAQPVAAESAPAAVPTTARYELPVEALQSLVEGAGLQWVHSDADRVRSAQEAIANAPQPIRVPREPKPRVAMDEGPLVLVETRKDLSQVQLPFDR